MGIKLGCRIGYVFSVMLLGGIGLFCFPGWAAENGQKGHPPHQQYDVSVVLKLVNEHVTDKQGKPVKDLSLEDFEIFDNGEAKKITEFERHVLKPAPAVPVMEPRSASAGSSRMKRKLFLIFDMSRSDIPGFKLSKKAALHFLDTRIEPSDEVEVLSFSEYRGLRLQKYLSSDHDAVRKIVEELSEVSGKSVQGGPTVASERARAEEEAGGAGGSDRPTVPDAGVDSLPAGLLTITAPEAEAAYQRNFNFVDVMRELAQAMRYIPGNKNVVLFSKGFSRALIQGDFIFRES